MSRKWLTFEPQVAALDFAPEILAIEKRPPAPLPRAVLYLLLLLFAIVVVWACFAKLDIVATAPGKLVPQTSVKIVQPAEAGIVKEILVEEGDRVRSGQVLLRLDTTVATADAAIVAREVEFRELQIRRIAAELSGKGMDQCDAAGRSDCAGPESLRLFREVEAQGIARQRAYRDALRTEEALETQAEEELLGARAQLVKLEQLLPILAAEDASLADLARQGLVPKFQHAEKQRARIDTEQNLASQRRTVTSLESRLTESRSRLARVTSEYRQELLTEQVEAQGALNKARQELAKQRHREVLNELRAPQDGVIKDVATYTVGAVVAAGTVLMTLVPSGEDLVAEVFIRNEDVGFVREGQSVKVKLAAYPFQKYGMIDGIVARISADAAELPQSNGHAPGAEAQREVLSPYKALVQLKHQSLSGVNGDQSLAPGMHVMAEVLEGERTVMEYLLSPVRKTVQEAAKER